MNLISKDLNPDSYSPHSISTYTCGVTLASRVHSDYSILSYILALVLPQIK